MISRTIFITGGTAVESTKGVVAGRAGRGFRGLPGRISAVVLAAAMLLLGAAGVVSADMRIVEVAEGQRTETYVKDNRVLVVTPLTVTTMLQCTTREMTIVSPVSRTYWQGSFEELQAEMEAMVAAFMEAFGGLAAAGGFEDEPVDVRVTRVGSDNVAGYAAYHYLVETGRDGSWEVFEEIWVSPDLLDEFSREAADCAELIREMDVGLADQLGGGFGTAEIKSVLSSPEYQALTREGYPVRTKTVTNLFGMVFESVVEVTEVSREPVPESLFAVSADYTRVESFFEIMMDVEEF